MMFSTRHRDRDHDRLTLLAAVGALCFIALLFTTAHDLPADGLPTTPAYAIDALARAEQEPQEGAGEGYVPGPGVTDDPSTWPDTWGDAPRHTQSCSNASVGKGGDHGQGGTQTNPTNCACTNRCIEAGLVPGASTFAHNHGDPRCKVTCRGPQCKCKPRCKALTFIDRIGDWIWKHRSLAS